MIVEQPELLREWICTALAPICDAEPDALAKYVMALLRKDVPDGDLKRCCVDQLDVFLQKHTEGFVDKLFNAVKDKSYLKTGKEPAVKSSKEASRPNRDTSSSAKQWSESTEREAADSTSHRHKGSSSGRSKMSSRTSGSRSRSRSQEWSKGSSGSGVPIGSSRYSTSRDRDGDSRSGKGRRSPVGAPKDTRKGSDKEIHSDVTQSSDSASARKDKDKRKRPRCRDYDEKGYCMLGDNCPFDHGPDPVVVEDFPLPMGDVASRPVKTAVVPPPPNFCVPPPGYAAVAHPAPADSKFQSEAYNPESPSLTSAPPVKGAVAVPAYSQPPPLLWSHPPPSVLRFASVQSFPAVRISGSQPADIRQVVDVSPAAGHNHHLPLPPYGGGPAGRKRFGRPEGQRMVYDKTNRTLEVRKIPVALNTISKLNGHFSQFGNVTNINVGFDNDPQGALVTYATRNEAVAAYKSTVPIFNNRFIRIFWHNTEAADAGVVKGKDWDQSAAGHELAKKNGTAQPAVGDEDKADQPASADHQAQSKKPSADHTGANHGADGITATVREKNRKRAYGVTAELRRANLDLLNKHLEHQKVLFAKLEVCDDPDMRVQLHEMIKQLEKSTVAIKEQIHGIKGARGEKRPRVEVQRELLDTELELMTRQEAGEDLSKLMAKLQSLRSEIKQTQHGESKMRRKVAPPFVASRKGRYSHNAATLDKRTRKVAISDVPNEEKEALVDHLQTFGSLEDIDFYSSNEPDFSVAVASFATRKGAEAAYIKGRMFNSRKLKMEWVDGKAAQKVVAVDECKENDEFSPKTLLANVNRDEGLADEVVGRDDV